ncbi:diacylglycerol kinase [Campylobacter sp. MIT 97-5078]|uniref:diacylglycerol kinase n=1 Tax=Campylobacter sp. MIT 97-5078 TaxID=1548153 RepID=UPI000512CF1A|nr:diacylglycerol kinase [Campylobacter sp. MIT 97-5078]KGI55945.1 hypothetical protein LR59_09715 [Campylobacter sp. MIT 97-5078]TQR27815.1 diacylglycerol kinase [Campylobacter sp. MIT 97-5078]
MKPKYSLFSNTSYALTGLLAMIKNERAFQIELVIIIPALIISFFLPVSLEIHLFLIAVLFFILIAECVNSSIEACVDLFTQEWHEKAKIAKDCASAAVFLSVCLAVGVWAFVLFALFF